MFGRFDPTNKRILTMNQRDYIILYNYASIASWNSTGQQRRRSTWLRTPLADKYHNRRRKLLYCWHPQMSQDLLLSWNPRFTLISGKFGVPATKIVGYNSKICWFKYVQVLLDIFSRICVINPVFGIPHIIYAKPRLVHINKFVLSKEVL